MREKVVAERVRDWRQEPQGWREGQVWRSQTAEAWHEWRDRLHERESCSQYLIAGSTLQCSSTQTHNYSI